MASAEHRVGTRGAFQADLMLSLDPTTITGDRRSVFRAKQGVRFEDTRRAYEGFSAQDCDMLHDESADKIWYTVSWKGRTDVRALWNKPVMICFPMCESALYSFQFVDQA